MTFLRRFWNRLGVKAVSRLCHSDITDSQSGFRLIRTEVLKEVDFSTSRFETELELLIKACKKGFSVISLSKRKGSMELVPAISGQWSIPGWFVKLFFEVCFVEEQDGFLPTS